MAAPPPIGWPDVVEVLVIGAGPVGLTVANLLGVAGIGTLVVEREPGLAQAPRAVALDDEGMRTLQAAGLVERIAPRMLMGYDHHLLGRHGQLLLKVDPAGQEFGFPKRNRFHQPELERVLLEGLDRFEHVETRFGSQLETLSIEAEGVIATVRAEGGPRQLRAGRLVACDGGASTVRRLLDIPLQGESHPEPWIVVDTENNPDDARFSRAVGSPRRPNVNVPGVGGRRRYEFMLLPGEQEAEATTEPFVRGLLEPWCDLDRVRIMRRTVYNFHSLIAERFSERRRVFLAGDAAHMMPPFQGQGMNSGMRDAFNLAWKLAAVVRGRLGDAVLDSYDLERRPHALEMIALSKRVGSILMTRNPLAAWFRDLAFGAMARIPWTRRYLGQMRFKPTPRAQAGFFLPCACGLPGRMFIQPDVLDGEGRRVPLDDVLGPGFALLQVAGAAEAAFAGFEHPFWRSLAARRIRVLPGGLAGGMAGADAVIADIGGAIARAVKRQPVTLLIRPDRYVAAVIAPGQADATAERLQAMAARDSFSP